MRALFFTILISFSASIYAQTGNEELSTEERLEILEEGGHDSSARAG